MQELYDDIERQYEDVRARLQQVKQELSSYEKIMTLLKEHIDENITVQRRLCNDQDEDTRKQAILRESYEKLQAKYDRFRKLMLDREDDYKKQLNDKSQLEVQLNSMKTLMTSIKKIQQRDVTNNVQEVTYDYDVETINFLNECNWNLGDSCNRGLAETLLGCFPSGTFLVRSSKTKPNSYVLSVVANSNVRHCLIDKVDEEYCFHPPNSNRQFYPSLCNLVMDYRHKSLVIHNAELDTNLVYPVLSQLKKNSKSGVMRTE